MKPVLLEEDKKFLRQIIWLPDELKVEFINSIIKNKEYYANLLNITCNSVLAYSNIYGELYKLDYTNIDLLYKNNILSKVKLVLGLQSLNDFVLQYSDGFIKSSSLMRKIQRVNNLITSNIVVTKGGNYLVFKKDS